MEFNLIDAGNATTLPSLLQSYSWDVIGLGDIVHVIAGIYLISAAIFAVLLTVSYVTTFCSSLLCPSTLPEDYENENSYCSKFKEHEFGIYGSLIFVTVVGGPFIPLHLVLYDGITKKEYSKLELWEYVMIPITVVHGLVNIMQFEIDRVLLFNMFSVAVVHVYKERLLLIQGNAANHTGSRGSYVTDNILKTTEKNGNSTFVNA